MNIGKLISLEFQTSDERRRKWIQSLKIYARFALTLFSYLKYVFIGEFQKVTYFHTQSMFQISHHSSTYSGAV